MSLRNPPVAVAKALQAYSPAQQKKLKQLRRIVLTTAESLGLGEIVETLKWSEPAYLPQKPRTGTTLRIGANKHDPNSARLYVNCQTSLIQTYKTLFPELQYEGNRGVIFDLQEPLPEDAIRIMVEAAMTYHKQAKTRQKSR
jgi:uncharacterized protein DUF1801